MKLKIFVDNREDSLIYNMLPDDEFDIEIKQLQVADYVCNNCIIERKGDEKDFIGSVLDGRIWQQCQDMLSVPDAHPYILVSASLRSFTYLGYDTDTIIGIITSLNRRGVSTLLVESDDNFIKFVKTFFKKYNDGKIRLVNPIRRLQVSTDDMVLYNYMSLPYVGPKTAEKLKSAFPIPMNLYSATLDKIMDSGIGKTKATKIHNFINGRIL